MINLRRASLFAVLVMIASSAIAQEPTPSLAKDAWNRATQRVWCTGVCEVYAAEIELAWSDRAPDADRVAMRSATRRARQAMRHGRWDDANTAIIGELRCAAKVGSAENRAFWCAQPAAAAVTAGSRNKPSSDYNPTVRSHKE